MKQYAYLILVGLAILVSSCASKFGKVLKSTDNEYKYKMAENYYAQKKYVYAQQLFNDLFPYVKGTPRFEDMYYKNAYSYYYQDDYLNAEEVFKTYVDNFPNSPRAEECEYMRAYCYYKQSPKVELDQAPTTRAMGFMQAFINMHPNSPRVKEATAIIDKCRAKLEEKQRKSSQLYYDLGQYKAAAIYFTDLMDSYPDSDRSDEYKFMVIKSYYKYAEWSFYSRQEERYEKVLSEITDFTERFSDSKYLKEVNSYKTNTNNSLKKIRNEQAKTAIKH